VIPICCKARYTCVSQTLSTRPPPPRVPVVGAPVSIQRTEEPLRRHDLPQAPEAAQGPFSLDEESRIYLGRRIIQGHNQIPLAAGLPLMGRTILVQHHAGLGFTRPLLLGPAIGALPAVLGLPEFVEVLDCPALYRVSSSVTIAQGIIHWYSAIRGSDDPPVLQPRRPSVV
jgi:hypothetical protein